ncbi:hypothetical protein BD309DRAFT_868653 [Dichomitus squalens]|uniref:Uncharacterized protein n=2 Tax=Dichomitus squalens TaxID=114155 RepID=A0A4Q9NJ21_9APHY|nr:uncharacterized protein DICSQDRAFT_69817 [Dichomitus squalens LYAD-421 SS1]EJF57268.1 hypothetical protein DICSQDRAFT_69817 [Dichomitus squalens LYAD-421 SS1]TBU41249.1 hypothetical protein BD309DRAFT_868653 [Dichomitus squalens]TBU54079.1 hypothetical protein BD310DRAFT_828707 [Dichomitus squalens]
MSRLITTYYLLDISANGYVPKTWEPRELWPQRFAYTTFRDALEFERLRFLFPCWRPHLDNHAFWNKAVAVLDPMGTYNHLTVVQPTPTTGSNAVLIGRMSMWQHYRHMLDASCIVCRVNFPYNGEGLCTGAGKRSSQTLIHGQINLCKEHRKGTAFCGVCLREAPRLELEEDYAQGMPVCCVENEDEETWPKIEATCRGCRTEAFWKRVNMRPEWQVAVDQRRWPMLDWETRQSVESFIDLGEGSIRDVLQVAEEKHWLRSYTKIGDMLQQALAASKFASRVDAGEAYGSDEEVSDDEMEDPEMLSLTEDAGGIRELAINDWVRNRILDGHWISPADDYFNHMNYGRPRLAPARHPCPWNRRAVYEGALDDGQQGCDGLEELTHPRPKTHLVPHPPTYPLAQQIYVAFQRQMREILLPPMRNVVRKLMMEASADGGDAGMRAHNMTVEDVVNELRDESAWYSGVDWLEVRQNRIEEEDRRRREREKDEDDSSSSSHSGGSHTTSPVLSTTTLQTTPSPPPVNKDEEAIVSSPLAGVPPPAPFAHLQTSSLRAAELLRPIPYVPVTTDHMAHYSREAFSLVRILGISEKRDVVLTAYLCRCGRRHARRYGTASALSASEP